MCRFSVGFSGMDDVELHATPIRPFLEHFRRELRAVTDCDRHRCTSSLNRSVQGRDNVATAERKPWLKQRSLTTKLIDDGEHPKSPAAERPGITGLAQLQGIDMSTPGMLAEVDARMLSGLTLTDYFRYVVATALGGGRGDRVNR
jgi:hypothetical protein